MRDRQLSAAARLLLLSYVLSEVFWANIFGQELTAHSHYAPPSAAPSGLLTNRLSPKELSRWESIEQLVFAEDAEQQPLHRTLRWMWQWLDTCGYAVYVEVIRVNRTSGCTAGNFTIERFDPRGERHIAVIKLNLPNIDSAYVGPSARRADGFAPFTDLNREERYAEVLGHEMSHAVHILTSFERTKAVFDNVQRTNEILLNQPLRRKSVAMAPELKARLSKRDELLRQLEKQAEEMEKVVWKELIESKHVRDKTPSAK